MSNKQENHAPPSCTDPICVHVEIVSFKENRFDRCRLEKPMHPKCPWYKSVDDLKRETKGGI